MLHKNLIQPQSIVVIGGSDNLASPGGRVLKNIIDHHFSGEIFVVNPKKAMVQGVRSYASVEDIPHVDLAIIAVAANFVLENVAILTEHKNTKGFIIFSAGFSEKDANGAKLEEEISTLIDNVGGSLLGPNNIGLINQNYAGVFTTPIPKLEKNGVDFISGSGATAVFILEAAAGIGLTFSSIYTVGNSAQNGVEEILQHLDETFDSGESSKVKILYIENIKNPIKFLKHATSLTQKGCKIAAIKAGSTDAGSRAASSHTGALANSDVFVDCLFQKGGIIRCFGRNELILVAGILMQKEAEGKNFAIITHAGGPAVMLTDVLTKNKMRIPQLKGENCNKLLVELYDGSSVANPIDFLATGTANQLEMIIDYCENNFETIDAMIIIFGSPGLIPVFDVYDVLDKKIKECTKPIYAILPSVVNVKEEIATFIAKNNIAFQEEVLFGEALAKVYNRPKLDIGEIPLFHIDENYIRKIINESHSGYLSQEVAFQLLQAVQIEIVPQFEVRTEKELLGVVKKMIFPVVQKVVGPLHKSDVGGVILGVENSEELVTNFKTLMQIKGAESVLIQPMKKGLELFIGSKTEENFPAIILCGLGGIFVEVLKDIQVGMLPLAKNNATKMIQNLKAFPILKGIRNQKGIDLNAYAENILKVAALVNIAPEIKELDINPLIASKDGLVAVDVRIRIEKS